MCVDSIYVGSNLKIKISTLLVHFINFVLIFIFYEQLFYILYKKYFAIIDLIIGFYIFLA